MRQTSLRRAPQRNTRDRTLGESTPLEPGRAVCPSCERHIPLNTDGTIRRHRTRHQDPLAPYCGTT